jgi:L-glyceraldehyde 3-phosphate reductase
LSQLAGRRGQSLAQMSLAWVLRHPAVTSALIGASRVDQLEQNIAALEHLDFSAEELERVEAILAT